MVIGQKIVQQKRRLFFKIENWIHKIIGVIYVGELVILGGIVVSIRQDIGIMIIIKMFILKVDLIINDENNIEGKGEAQQMTINIIMIIINKI